MFAILFPQIDPVIVNIGSFSLRWYSLAYIFGIIIGAFLMNKMSKLYKTTVISSSEIEDMTLWATFGIIIGGRLGYIIFYNLDLAIRNPLWILKIWEGGMSFHGGAIGLAISIYIYCKKHGLDFIKIIDMISCVAPIGLFLGRVANFINGELYGVESNVPWAVVFPYGGDTPRHPSQLYEAMLEGVVLFIIMNFLFYNTKLNEIKGKLSGVFMFLYASFRIFSECYREPTDLFLGFTMGTALSIPMLISGVYILYKCR